MSASVCLVISSYKNDEKVAALLEAAAPLIPALFSRAIVVDSLGTGAIAALIEERAWSLVHYESAAVNLGSAGNLARRLELAAATGADYAYALNHDGALSGPTVATLIQAASRVERVGAAYPLRVLANRARAYDVTGTSRFLLPRRTTAEPPRGGDLRAYWGSSNGALYALEPVRKGLCPWADFWMGWEDLAYGWLLESKGYRQVIVPEAVFEDPYEFRPLGPAGKPYFITEKPTWYEYYFARNLLLMERRLRSPWNVRASVVCRIALECGTAALMRSRRRERIQLLARGIVDGLRGVTGKMSQE